MDFIGKGQEVAIKIHFGEEENTGYVKPFYAHVVVDEVIKERPGVF